MSETVTKQDLHLLLRDQTDEITGILSTFMQQADGRFSKLENEIVNLRKSHERLLNTIDRFVSRIDRYETELAARDHKIERLERWIQELSKQTGIKLS
jgi:chromosome segregation ATPase